MKRIGHFTGMKIVIAAVGILGVALPIISGVEGKKPEGWFLCVLLLFACLMATFGVLKWMDKRVSALENRLHDPGGQDEIKAGDG